MKKKRNRAVGRASKSLYVFLAIGLLVQPVGNPGIWSAYPAQGQSAVEAQSEIAGAGQAGSSPNEQSENSLSGSDAAVLAEDENGSAADSTNKSQNESAASPGEENPSIGSSAPTDAETSSGATPEEPVSDILSNGTSGDSFFSAVETEKNSDPAAQDVISPDAASTSQPATEEKGKICLKDSADIVSSEKSDWDVSGNAAETKKQVELGVKYIFPLNDKVSVTFTCLPASSADRANLKIQQIASTEINLPQGTSAAAEYAYDITTNMENGDFEYKLGLPKSEVAEAEINYIEKSASDAKNENLDGADLKTVEESQIEIESDNAIISNLDHFTIWIATFADNTFSSDKEKYERGETVFAKAGNLSRHKYYRLAINPPGFFNTAYITDCVKADRSKTIVGSYILEADAKISDNWKAELKSYGYDSHCQIFHENQADEDYFEVTEKRIPSAANPELPETCGLDIALVLDNSTSISSSEMSQMKSAVTAFTNALAGTPTRFSVIRFADEASVLRSFTGDIGSVNDAINAIPVGGGYTNWEDGFKKAKNTFDPRPNPNLVIFASDGNPNTNGDGPGGNATPDGSPAAMNPAIEIANELKSDGTRILAIGIGSDLAVENMKAVAGAKVNTGDILTSDVITTDFSGLSAQLAALASETCGGTITINKYIDAVSGSERGGENWKFNVNGPDNYSKDLKSDSNGQAVTEILAAGSGYSVVEKTDLMPEGYGFGSVACYKQNPQTHDPIPVGDPVVSESGNPGVQNITVEDSDIITCDFVNKTLPKTYSPVLSLTKSNDKYPIDQIAGSDVTYLLQLRVLEANLHGLQVTDLPPAGFSYRSGSARIFLNDARQFGVPEPDYQSPGVWDLASLGTLKPGDEVKLYYTADISENQDPGVYPDLAWAEGVSDSQEKILANVDQDDPFVGTKVGVAKPAGTVAGVSVEIEKETKTRHKKKKTERVTKILPATGANPGWIALAITFFFLGTGLILAGKKESEKKNLTRKKKSKLAAKILPGSLALFLALFLGENSWAATANIAARMEDPKTPVNSRNFLVGFVALDRLNREMTVECFADDSKSPFQTFKLAPGGTSGNCAVRENVVLESGTYKFHIKASAGSDSVMTSDAVVEVVLGGPQAPTDYKRTKVSGCENNLKAMTANDGKTVRVEIYRSTETNFTADAQTLAASIDIGPNEQLNHTDAEPDCGETYYYAIRAFDALGNGSKVVADERTVVRTTGGGTRTVTTTVGATEAGPVVVGAGEAVAGEIRGGASEEKTEDKQTTPSKNELSKGEEGQVLGEEKTAEDPRNFPARSKILAALISLVIAAILYYAFSKKEKNQSPK